MVAGAFEEAIHRYDIPVVEVIRPAVRRAMAVTRTGEVGVIGTSGTIASGGTNCIVTNPGYLPQATSAAGASPMF